MPSVRGTASNGVATGIGSITVTLPVGVAEGDLTLLFVMTNSGSNRVFTEVSSTWVKLADEFIAGAPNDVNCALFRKIQGAVPDTDVTVTVDSTNNAMAAVLVAIQDPNINNPEDVPIVIVSSAGASDPDPGPITTITNGALVVAFAASSEGDAISNPPVGYSSLVDRQQGSTVNVMAAVKEVAVAGVEDPGAFTDLAADAGDSWITITYAVRPPDVSIPAPAVSRAVSLLGVSGGAPLIAPPPPSFIMFDEFRYRDLSHLGFQDIFFQYQSGMVAPGDQATDPPDPAYLDDFFAQQAAANPGVNRIVLDYEAWDITIDASATGINTTVVGWYVTLINAAKAHFSDVGMYGELTERYTGWLTGGPISPMSATNAARLADWKSRSDMMQPMWDVVDTIYPSFYYINPTHNDAAKRDFWYQQNLIECHRKAPGKKVYCVLGPKYHISTQTDPDNPWIPGQWWRDSLETVLAAGYDGFVGWDVAGQTDPYLLNPIPDWVPQMEAFAATVT